MAGDGAGLLNLVKKTLGGLNSTTMKAFEYNTGNVEKSVEELQSG